MTNDATDTPDTADEVAQLRAQIETLERERGHLTAISGLLQELPTLPRVRDMLHAISRRLGDACHLDRCSILLNTGTDEARLLASYEDPALSNLVIDLERYPEVERAVRDGAPVIIDDATTEPSLTALRTTFGARNIRSIVVVPIRSEGTVIGTIFMRTRRDQPEFSSADMTFATVIASITANALRTAHVKESVSRQQPAPPAAPAPTVPVAESRDAAMVAFMRRVLDRHESKGTTNDALDALADRVADALRGTANG